MYNKKSKIFFELQKKQDKINKKEKQKLRKGR